jgi:hypothetical protein
MCLDACLVTPRVCVWIDVLGGDKLVDTRRITTRGAPVPADGPMMGGNYDIGAQFVHHAEATRAARAE